MVVVVESVAVSAAVPHSGESGESRASASSSDDSSKPFPRRTLTDPGAEAGYDCGGGGDCWSLNMDNGEEGDSEGVDTAIDDGVDIIIVSVLNGNPETW